jgi:hypothetical protein
MKREAVFNEHHYESYIHGMMDGKALTYHNEHNIRVRSLNSTDNVNADLSYYISCSAPSTCFSISPKYIPGSQSLITMPPTPGLIFAAGRITNPKWAETTFNKWYNTVHVPQTFSTTNGPKAGFRFKNQDPKALFSYLALYPTNDIHADTSDAAEKLKLTDELVPDGESYLNLTAWDVRLYRKIETLGSGQSGFRIGKRLVTVEVEPGAGAKDLWYDPKHLEMLKSQNGYLRSHGYALDEARVPSGKASDERILPKYLAVHEFEDTEIPPQHIEFHGPDEGRQNFKDAEMVVRDVWEVIFEAGDDEVGL